MPLTRCSSISVVPDRFYTPPSSPLLGFCEAFLDAAPLIKLPFPKAALTPLVTVSITDSPTAARFDVLPVLRSGAPARPRRRPAPPPTQPCVCQPPPASLRRPIILRAHPIPKPPNSVDLKDLLVRQRVPVMVVGEGGGRDFTIALAALRGKFDGITSSHDIRESFIYEPRFSDEATLLGAIDEVWRRAEANVAVSSSERIDFTKSFRALRRQVTAQRGAGLGKILRNLSRTADARHLQNFFRWETDAPSSVIYYPFPFHWDNTARLITEFIDSAGRCQRAGDLLLIAVSTLHDQYEKASAHEFAMTHGYEVLPDDREMVEACFRSGYSRTSFSHEPSSPRSRVDTAMRENSCTWVFRRTSASFRTALLKVSPHDEVTN